jgi:hypothetical protein
MTEEFIAEYAHELGVPAKDEGEKTEAAS